MGARTGTPLRLAQWFTRAIEFCCAALILAIFSYFLATLTSHSLTIAQWIRAVEGIAGAAVIYTILTLLLLFCAAGHPVLSSIFIFLDICFAGAFIYLAATNRDGASSCDGDVNTPLGRGDSATNTVENGQGGVITIGPSLQQACKMQSACLAVSIVGILFFILSAILETLLIRHRRKAKRFGPSPVNGYTSGYGKTKGFFGRFQRKKQPTDLADNPNALPEHPHPDDLNRVSYGTEQTRVNTSHGHPHDDPDTLPPTHNSPLPPMSGVNTGYRSYGYKPDSSAPGAMQGPGLRAYTHNTEFANTGSGGGRDELSVGSVPARYPPGNYRYDDGVYDRI